MKLVHDDHVEIVWIDLVDAVGKGLHRSKDVVTRAWTLAADQPFTKPRLTEHKLEDLLALAEDLVTVRDEEQGMTYALIAQPLKSNAAIQVLPVPVAATTRLRWYLRRRSASRASSATAWWGFRRDVDQQRQQGAVVFAGVARAVSRARGRAARCHAGAYSPRTRALASTVRRSLRSARSPRGSRPRSHARSIRGRRPVPCG